ncbi:hydroxyethylthiazole kinase [Desulfotruncus alcoholivorax]|uniref:hydroxyethylthiazole kinase n=1 Tax=Desulfotruncus alcoholivorax TaxID=265477 RepID=UPI0003FB42E2|nr:hydroxyethylthiazole kinase [Desulfotruncus alcoholivorax]
MEKMLQDIAAGLMKIRETRPLIHNITNMVVMNDTANILLHIGASPVMAHAREEVEEMVALSGALVLNIGTLTPELVESMIIAGKKANRLGVPVVLDPVGAGATSLRTRSSLRILNEINVTILRGNAAEIAVLAGLDATVKGVDAAGVTAGPGEISRLAAEKFGLTVAVTGQIDAVSDGRRTVLIENGHRMMGGLTGTGCMSTALTGAFAAVCPDPLTAAAGALISFGIAGEQAALRGPLPPGSYKVSLFDQVYDLSPDKIISGARVTVY